MALIVPTITAEELHGYRSQIEVVEPFASRIHIDLMDGVFTPNKSIEVEQAWLPENIQSDIHLMFQNPHEYLEKLIKLKPDLVIIPAESKCNIANFAKALNENEINCGIALLADTSVETITEVIGSVQHVLVFSGNLGYQGGSFANLKLLEKVAKAKTLNPGITVGWDGGVNETNVRALAAANVDFINVGGYIQSAPDPALAYKTLVELIA